MATRRFRLVVLTPVHIGSGEPVSREEYVIEGGKLIRFNPHAVLRDMKAEERRQYETLLDSNRLEEAQRMLQALGKQEKYRVFAIDMGAGSLRGLGRNWEERCGEVHLMQRNAMSGQIVVPGSSIKGAIRTAVVSVYARSNLEGVKKRVEAESDKNKKARVLEEEALKFSHAHTEGDPLRFLRVRDAHVGGSQARVDKATVYRRDGTALEKMQMHFERLVSVGDDKVGAECLVEMEVDEAKQRDPRVGRAVKSELSWDFVMKACGYFYGQRLKEEKKSFEEVPGSWPDIEPHLRKGNGMVLRLGRFSHFESLSVDGLRRGWNVQAQRPIEGMGSTRTLCELKTGKQAPFGWVWLEAVGE